MRITLYTFSTADAQSAGEIFLMIGRSVALDT